MTHTTRIACLTGASILIIAFGISLSWFQAGPASVGTVFFLDVAFWPVDGAQGLDTDAARLLAGISGGLTAGLGAAILAVTRQVYATDPARGGRIMATSMLVWFVVDGIGSVIAGAPVNVALNAVFLAIVLVPLWAPARAAPAE
jgi:hypothetical protein